MDTTTIVLAAIAIVLLVVAFFQRRDLPLEGLRIAGRLLWGNLPLLLISFVLAGLVQVLIPKEIIAKWLGEEGGIKAILIASAAGGLRLRTR